MSTSSAYSLPELQWDSQALSTLCVSTPCWGSKKKTLHLPTKFEADEVLLTHLNPKLAPLHHRNYCVRQQVLSLYCQMIQVDCCSVDDSTDVVDFP